MPLYYFNLLDGSGGISDPDGTDLADRTAAEGHARAVVLELMAHVEVSTRHWLLEVCDESGRKLFQVPFVKIDQSIDHLKQRTRGLIEEVSQRRRALASAIFSARATIQQTRALVARSRRLPRIATDRGRMVD
jgi:hypothetical protein